MIFLLRCNFFADIEIVPDQERHNRSRSGDLPYLLGQGFPQAGQRWLRSTYHRYTDVLHIGHVSSSDFTFGCFIFVSAMRHLLIVFKKMAAGFDWTRQTSAALRGRAGCVEGNVRTFPL